MVLLNDIISSSNIIDLSIEDSEVSFPFADLIGSPDYSRPRSVFFATKDSTCTWYKEPFDRNYFIREISRKCPEWLVVTDLAKVKKANIRNFIVVQSVEQTLIRLIEKIPKLKNQKLLVLLEVLVKVVWSIYYRLTLCNQE